jgi:hypothetical protein
MRRPVTASHFSIQDILCKVYIRQYFCRMTQAAETTTYCGVLRPTCRDGILTNPFSCLPAVCPGFWTTLGTSLGPLSEVTADNNNDGHFFVSTNPGFEGLARTGRLTL